MDSPETSADLSRKLGLSFTVLSDRDRGVIRTYGVEDGENGIAWPAIFVVGSDGKIAWRSLSETYKVRALAGDILSALDSLRR